MPCLSPLMTDVDMDKVTCDSNRFRNKKHKQIWQNLCYKCIPQMTAQEQATIKVLVYI